nr:hypothetical protein [Pseudomonadota bacterium]
TAAGTSYYISGNYDANGVITGNVLYGDFSAGAANDGAARTAAAGLLTTATGTAPTAPQTVGLGVLSGLIGAQGAVGGFHSSGSDGNGETGFAGGFVVSSADNVGGIDPDVVYADWAAGATQATVITDNAFLAGTATGLTGAPSTGVDVETLNLAEVITAKRDTVQGVAGNAAANAGVAGIDGVALGGQAADGVAFFTNGDAAAARFFAGLHSTTDLGEPIAAAADIVTTNGEWAGLFQAVGADGYATAARDITLTVTFGATDGNTITAIVAADDNTDTFTTAGDESYYISGRYDANGVITGSVLYRGFATATANTAPLVLAAAGTALTAATATGATGDAVAGLGVLSGLIGQDGAVGAFYSNADGATGYAGGFVASRDERATDEAAALVAFVPPVVEYADLTDTRLMTLAANGFLGSSGTDVLDFTAPTNAPTIGKLDLATGTAGGVSFFTSGASDATAFFFAGIHNDTNLGAPVPTSGNSATWTGMFQAVGTTGAATITPARAITLSVAFATTDAARLIAGSVSAGTQSTLLANPAYHISATYDENGVISGNILYEASSAATGTGIASAAAAVAGTAGGGTVTGLIGASGLVGAFHSSNTVDGATGILGYSGGFIAAPGS